MAKRTIKILVIDDQADSLIVLKALVNESFPEAVFIAADSSKNGFELCQSEKPDVILLDNIMSGMDGYELCTKIKSDIILSHIPVIMVTANHADKGSRVKALDSGADAFLQKPFDDSELTAHIRAMLRKKESEDKKKEEKHRLEDLILDRTEELENELAERKKAENKLIQSLDKITKNRQAIMNLMEDLKVEIEERKLVEKNLKVERNLLRTLIDNIPDTIYVFDKECRKIIANKADVEIAGGKSEADLLGKTDLVIYPGETGERLYSDSKEVVKSEKPKIDKVEKFLRKNGEIRYLNMSQYPLYDTNGLCIGLVGIGHDFTDRKNANDKLVESEERYRLLIENQGEGLGIVNLEEKFVFVNPAAEEMFGVEKGSLLNRNLMDLVKPEHKAIIKRETKKRTNAEKSSYEIDIIRPNGEQRTLIITATPQFTNDGILSGTFGVFRDITERKRMEQKIIESEAYYRTLVDISPDGIIITNLEGNVLYGSKKAYEIFGIPSGEDVTGTSILRWLAPDSQDAIMERVMEIMKGDVAPATREFKLMKFDGSAFWGEISSSLLSDKEGNPLSLIIVCRDISDRKKSEYEIIKSKEKAEESDRLKTAFLHNISHEIRTPMNAIIGFSTLLSEPDLDKESHKSFIEIIIQSSNHLLTIVSDIIEISNIEAGILKLNVKNINLNCVLETIHNQFLHLASEKNNNYNIDIGLKDGEAQVWTDETKLTQILSILLSNALKFTSGGKITMGYRIKGNFIEFFVSDTGIGIPKEQFSKIFERFYQVENTIARQYEGTGLGLSIAKAYVELLGGKIWLISEPGSGTTFLFTIPYSSANPTLKEEKKSVVIEDLKKYENKTILIAEDEENNYRLVENYLSGLNLKIIHARNGKEAVDICDSGDSIDLVLMDIKMPVMDGLEATTMLKYKRPSLPVIAQTAFAFESDRDKVFKAGCDDYLCKPIKKDILILLVKKYL